MNKQNKSKDVLCPYCHKKLNDEYEPRKIKLMAKYEVLLSAIKGKNMDVEIDDPEETDIMEIFDYDPDSYTCPYCGKSLGKNNDELDKLFGGLNG